MIFQEPMTSLNPVFSVGNQLIETIMTHTDLSRKEAKGLAIELLRKVRIPSPEIRIKEYPHQMSGGMRQRIMIAMAIACKPDLIIADEPTTALDVTIQAQILELLSELRGSEGVSILLITHDLGIVAEWAESVDVMYAGRIMESTSVKDLFTSPLHPYTMGLLESLPSPGKDTIKPIPGQIPRLDQLPQGCKFMPRCRYSIRECGESEPELRNIKNGHYVRCIRAGEIQ
jgi:oligopeptide/dipeptide ABC transporter ATP-binding protein